MSNAVKRLVEVAGENFDHPKCRVTNPHITARESIEVGNYIVDLKRRLKHQIRSNKKLKTKLKQHEQLAAKGIYYTLKELEESRKQLVLNDLLNPSGEVKTWVKKIKAQAIRDAMSACKYHITIDGRGISHVRLSKYADKLEQGEE